MDYTAIVALLAGVPYVGPVLAIALGVLVPASLAATALMAMFHALVQLLSALAMIKGLSGLQSLADSLKKDDDKVTGLWNGTIKPILDRLSLIPLPKK